MEPVCRWVERAHGQQEHLALITETQPTPAAASPYVPAWALYIYDDRAYVTFNGKLEATATCRTPAQQARIETTLARLNERAPTSH